MTEKIEGVNALRRKFKALSANTSGNVLRKAVAQAMTPIRRTGQAVAPRGERPHRTHKGLLVAPGYASRHVKKRSRTSRDKSRAYADVGVTAQAFYATQFVDIGTRYITRTRWLTGTFTDSETATKNLLKEKLKDQIEKARRK